ncbi:MAG: hypothetical protein ACO30S_07940 [Flavobacteriaceae bacterium]
MRVSESQRQRTQQDPLVLGTFSQLSLRNLKGTLGPANKVVGRSDTRSNSNGGFGGGTYNNWFQINITSPAWLIIAKGGPRPNYIEVSAYDLNMMPMQERGIFQFDSLVTTQDGETYHPYVGHVMGAGSDFYNNFVSGRLDQGNSLYFPLQTGSYLLCVSTTRNEPLNYELAIVIEFPTTNFDLLLEDYFYLLYEDLEESYVDADIVSDFTSNDVHVHSLSDWQTAWNREHQQDDRFPAILVPLTTQP